MNNDDWLNIKMNDQFELQTKQLCKLSLKNAYCRPSTDD